MKAGRPARARLRRMEMRSLTQVQSTPSLAAPASKPPRKLRSLVPASAARGMIPDLLHAEPAISVDEPALLNALSFAFVAGSAGGALQSALTRTALAPSSFTPETLQDGLFLDELLQIALEFPLQGKPAPIDHAQLRRLLTQPPLDPRDVRERQAVFAELAERPELQRALERAYTCLAALPALLEDQGSDARLDATQWRLDVLRTVRDGLRALASGGFDSTHSALRRLHVFGERVRESAGFARLEALLDFEGDSARADIEVRLGADGRIRALDILALRPRRSSPFHVGPLRRGLRRLVAWLQGYVLGPNEIIDRWLENVFDGVREHVPLLFQLKGDLEFYLGVLHFKALAEARQLPVCLPELVEEGEKLALALWNPLLLAEPALPIATDVHLPSFACTCITTGPNSGGKTRFLQALGLCQLLGQAGAFVPARRVTLRCSASMFVSLGEAPHADQKEGRLGMELVRVRKLFEQAKRGAFVVLDELCSGTNPSEGEEIFRMLLELLHELDHEVHITTHFLSFAQALQSEAEALGLCFLQVELDDAQHPTYRFVPGVATTSLAQQTAERLGVTREQLRGLIRR
jgi:DNA mismatch repair protein MutS2